MAENNKVYAIKYKKIEIDKFQYLLIPTRLVEGELSNDNFISEGEILPFLKEKEQLNKQSVIVETYSTEELRTIYQGPDETPVEKDLLLAYFLFDKSNSFMYVKTNNDNEVEKIYHIDLEKMSKKEDTETYLYEKDKAAVILNEDSLNTLMSINNIKEVKILLEKYKKLVNSFKDYKDSDCITRVEVKCGKINSIETGAKITNIDTYSCNNIKKDEPANSDFSYKGLSNYIKEYVFGQDESIDTFAQKLYMNCTAEEGEIIDSILLVGPTGTGKTETIEAAGRYLHVPYFAYNASNLNAEGIVGTSIEDILCSLYEMSGRDLKKAQRGLVFFDEFDKLNDSDLDTKTILKNILLTFNGGGRFPVNSKNYSFTFDTLMTNKVYAGVFKRIEESNNKTIGFDVPVENKNNTYLESDIRKKIIENGYFTLEELSRISTILPYKELDRDTKIKILKESKLSTLAQKKSRYKRQFNLDIETTDDFIDAIIEKLDKSETGMRSLNNILKRIIDCAEKEIISNTNTKYKKLVLTKKTVDDPNNFDLS